MQCDPRTLTKQYLPTTAQPPSFSLVDQRSDLLDAIYTVAGTLDSVSALLPSIPCQKHATEETEALECFCRMLLSLHSEDPAIQNV
jgi:hypothetical protein